MRELVTVFALLLATSACAYSDVEHGPHRLVAQRLVVLADGSIAVAGVAVAGSGEDSGCRSGGAVVRDFFVTRIDARGRLLRTDIISEEQLDKCGSRVIDARRGQGGRVAVTGWWTSPPPGSVHGPVDLSFAADGSTSHDFATAARRLGDYGVSATAETALPGGGYARMWALGPRDRLRLEIRRPGRPAVRTPSGAHPPDAQYYDIWVWWYSLSADSTGLYGSGPYTRGPDVPYYFPIFRHRLDGSLDDTFGGDGVVLAHPPGLSHYVTTQAAADGRGGVLAVGGGDEGARQIAYVMRFRQDGTLDAAFGRAGIVRLDVPRPSDDEYTRNPNAAVGVLADGRIVVTAGVDGVGSHVWLLRSDGSPDRSFGRNGRLVLRTT